MAMFFRQGHKLANLHWQNDTETVESISSYLFLPFNSQGTEPLYDQVVRPKADLVDRPVRLATNLHLVRILNKHV